MVNYTRHPASFKDPSGFVFRVDDKIYRQVNQYYSGQYKTLMDSGLYNHLVKKGQLISHTEVNENLTQQPGWHSTLVPDTIDLITYPYEWCFEQLKDAALLTLNILRVSLEYGMALKDATPFNIQFKNGKPVLIDTLSFDYYNQDQPWIAYRQFCQTFLFPLYLEYYLKSDIQRILSTYIDGIPIDITARLLPLKSNLNIGVWLHVYLQNATFSSDRKNKVSTKFTKRKLLNIVSHLEGIINRFPSDRPLKTTWSNYYEGSDLFKDYLQEKEKAFLKICSTLTARTALDLGCNDGYFSKLLSSKGMMVVAADTDTRCISKLYQQVKKNNNLHILPLVLDISNPSPAVGFNNTERASFFERIKADLVVALALIHHLVIGKNIGLQNIADWLRDIAPQLIIEFVPKEDGKVMEMLKSRVDSFPDYDQQHFELYFNAYFNTIDKINIPGTSRTLYRMQRKH